MSPIGVVVVLSAVATVGILIAASGWRQPAPSLRRTVQHLQRAGSVRTVGGATVGGRGALTPPARFVRSVVELMQGRPRLLPSEAELHLVGRSIEQHAVGLVASALAGLVAPPLLLTLLQAAGIVGLGWFVPLAAALGGAALGPLLVHTVTVERAAAIRGPISAIRSRPTSTS